ncbi:MAG: hypothetical protein DHS20C12_26060 [Pseudohongiella sp.]|nr:MAG: hypothetical protein DHS20C12_26060 [Pseudohongiella sp.]
MLLILGSLLCIQILSAAREPILAGWDLPLWLYALDASFILLNLAFVIWCRSGKLPSKFNYPLVTIAFIMTGLKPVAFMLAYQDPGPFYTAVVMLAGALCFLSARYLLYSMGAILTAWVSVAILVLPIITLLSCLAVILLGSALSLFVQNRRIFAAIEVFVLKQKLEALESILPMCANCKKTRNEDGEWKSIEEYIEDRQTGTLISHGSCPTCTQEMYGDLLKNRKPSAEAS